MREIKGTHKLLACCLLALCETLVEGQNAPPPGLTSTYVGSATCKSCHPAIYERWSKTRMANVVTDPKVHPEVIIPDLTMPDPLVTFTREDVAFVYGSKRKQRYFQKVGDDYFPHSSERGGCFRRSNKQSRSSRQNKWRKTGWKY
jgi:hypothetical protein